MEPALSSIPREEYGEYAPDSAYSLRPDADGQDHVFEDQQEVRLSQRTLRDRRVFFQDRFTDLQRQIEQELGQSLIITHTNRLVEVSLNRKKTPPDGYLEYQFAYSDSQSDLEVMYVSNSQAQTSRTRDNRRRLHKVTSLLLAYLLVQHPEITKIHSVISGTNLSAAKLPPERPGRYGRIVQTPMYKARAALGFGKVDQLQGTSLTTTFF